MGQVEEAETEQLGVEAEPLGVEAAGVEAEPLRVEAAEVEAELPGVEVVGAEAMGAKVLAGALEVERLAQRDQLIF